jgi:hypothetical protein
VPTWLCFFLTFLAPFYLMTRQNRRRFLQCSAALSALGLTSLPNAQSQLPSPLSSLHSLGDRVRPITPDESHGRLIHAQQLMSDLRPKFDAILMGPGTSLYYFTGIRWGLSERLLGLVIPRTGRPVLVSDADTPVGRRKGNLPEPRSGPQKFQSYMRRSNLLLVHSDHAAL